MTPTLINLTPHPITLHLANGTTLTIEPRKGPDGKPAPARVVTGSMEVGGLYPDLGLPIQGAPLAQDVEGLPGPTMDADGNYQVFYLVSGMVLEAYRVLCEHSPVPPRYDLLAPATGPNDAPVRDGKGNVIGVTRLNAL